MKNMHDVVVIGGGPAGVAATITAARRGLKVRLVAESLGGQLNEIGDVENWPGQERLPAKRLTAKLAQQITELGRDVDYQRTSALKIQKIKQLLLVTLANGETASARTVVVATGARHGLLNIPGEKSLLNKGVSYCVTCDAPYYKGKIVVVCGQAEQALSIARQLARVVAHVYLLLPHPIKSATVDKRITVLPNASATEIVGREKVTAVRYRSGPRNQIKELTVSGIFIAVKPISNSEFVVDLLDLDNEGYIRVNHRTMSTSEAGAYAAGDVTNGLYKQIPIAVGEGVKAALSAANYIDKQLKQGGLA